MQSVPLELDELPYLDGRAWTFGDHVKCEQLLPVGPPRGYPAPAGTVPEFAHDLQPGDFLVVGVGFGIGAAAEWATSALQATGLGAVIGRSFTSDFFVAALRIGFPALQVEETAAIKTGDRLRVDIEGHKVVNLSSGDRYVIRNAHGQELDALRAGGLDKLLEAKVKG